MVHPDTYEPQAVSFTKARQEWRILDESIKSDFDAVAKLDHGDFSIYDRDDADHTWLIGFDKDDGPISYYAYDRENKKGTFLFVHRPVLQKYTLAQMEPISFTSRDGLTIHGYITYPPGKAKTNLPTVLNVHGGPWYRDMARNS
jgi:dipeptidyl aminopeptidase/acylaminoacyl peptidase